MVELHKKKESGHFIFYVLVLKIKYYGNFVGINLPAIYLDIEVPTSYMICNIYIIDKLTELTCRKFDKCNRDQFHPEESFAK